MLEAGFVRLPGVTWRYQRHWGASKTPFSICQLYRGPLSSSRLVGRWLCAACHLQSVELLRWSWLLRESSQSHPHSVPSIIPMFPPARVLPTRPFNWDSLYRCTHSTQQSTHSTLHTSGSLPASTRYDHIHIDPEPPQMTKLGRIHLQSIPRIGMISIRWSTDLSLGRSLRQNRAATVLLVLLDDIVDLHCSISIGIVCERALYKYPL